jgi:hypothetical protein
MEFKNNKFLLTSEEVECSALPPEFPLEDAQRYVEQMGPIMDSISDAVSTYSVSPLHNERAQVPGLVRRVTILRRISQGLVSEVIRDEASKGISALEDFLSDQG